MGMKSSSMLCEAAVGYNTEKEDHLGAVGRAILETRRNARQNGESEVYDREAVNAHDH
jgi:hypothetical protein